MRCLANLACCGIASSSCCIDGTVGCLVGSHSTLGGPQIKGVLALSVLCFTAAVIGSLLSQFGWVIEIIVAAILLAQKSLIDHVRAVATGLRTSIEEGRFAVSMIVSRDTKDMNEARSHVRPSNPRPKIFPTVLSHLHSGF